MNPGTLSQLPDWPALMDVETATLYLGNKPQILEVLVERGYLAPLTDRHRCRTFRRSDLDAALALAKAKADSLEARCVREQYQAPNSR